MAYREQRWHVQKGFTFMELVVAVMILGILATVVGFGYRGFIKTAKENTTKANLKTVKSAIDLFSFQYGRLPASPQDLVEQPKGEFPGWHSYLEKMPKDGWGRDFYYKLTPGKKHGYELYSYGAEGPEGPVENQISVWD